MCFLWPKHYTRHLRNVFLSNNKYKLLINCIVKLQIFDFTKKNFSFKIYLKGNVIMLSLKLNISFSHGILQQINISWTVCIFFQDGFQDAQFFTSHFLSFPSSCIILDFSCVEINLQRMRFS